MTTPSSYPPPGPLGATDPSRWRLSSQTDGGRHVWFYQRDPASPSTQAYEQLWGSDDAGVREGEQNDESKYWLGLDLPKVEGVDTAPAKDPFEAAKKGTHSPSLSLPDARLTPFLPSRLRILQASSVPRRALVWRVRRCVPSCVPPLSPPRILTTQRNPGPMFLLPGIIIALYVTKTPIPEEWKIEIARYLSNLQRKGGEDDQGWGMYVTSSLSRLIWKRTDEGGEQSLRSKVVGFRNGVELRRFEAVGCWSGRADDGEGEEHPSQAWYALPSLLCFPSFINFFFFRRRLSRHSLVRLLPHSPAPTLLTDLPIPVDGVNSGSQSSTSIPGAVSTQLPPSCGSSRTGCPFILGGGGFIRGTFIYRWGT
jgi:hypothetical protein